MKGSTDSSQESQQYLTFLLKEQKFGLETFKIREIRGYAPVTPIPNVLSTFAES